MKGFVITRTNYYHDPIEVTVEKIVMGRNAIKKAKEYCDRRFRGESYNCSKWVGSEREVDYDGVTIVYRIIERNVLK